MSRALAARWVHWLPAAVWALTIFVLSAQSRLPTPPDGLSDKHGHGLAFGVLALACIHGLTAGQWRRTNGGTVAAAIGMAVLYGMSDEFHQMFVPGRTAEWADVRADAIGAAVAGALVWAWAILLRRRDRRRLSRASDGRPRTRVR